MINKVFLIANLGKTPELKYTASGQAVCNLALATSEKYTDKQGNKQEKTEWHTVVLFGKHAELASQYLDKGSKVYIEGKLQTRSWQDKSGETRYTTEIVGQEMRFLSSKGDSSDSRANKYSQQVDNVNAQKSKSGAVNDQDNLPF